MHHSSLGLLSRFSIQLLIVLLAFEPLFLGRPAYGSSSELTQNLRPAFRQPKLRISFGRPNQGLIDRAHPLEAVKNDLQAAALYILRTTYVEDLIATRIQLKGLLGGKRQSQKVFSVPQDLKRLYQPSEHVFEDFGESFDWLDSTEPAYEGFREDYWGFKKRSLAELAAASAAVVALDYQLGFISKIYFQDPRVQKRIENFSNDLTSEAQIKFEVDQELLRATRGNFISLANRSLIEARVRGKYKDLFRKRYLEESGITEQASVVAGLKARILNFYRPIGLKENGRYMYEKIYKVLVNRASFPEAKDFLNVDHRYFSAPLKGKGIELPDGFDQAITKSRVALGLMLEDVRFNTVAISLEELVDPVLEKQLDANTQELAELSSPQAITFDGSARHPLMRLAGYSQLWKSAKLNFNYLKGDINLDAARKLLEPVVDASLEKREVRDRFYYGVGFGLGVAGIVASVVGSSGVAAVGSAPFWLGVGSGFSFAIGASLDFYDSAKAAEVARRGFLAGKRSADFSQFDQAVLLRHEDFTQLMMALVGLGLQSNLFAKLANARKVYVTAEGQEFVALTQKEAAQIAKTLGSTTAPKLLYWIKGEGAWTRLKNLVLRGGEKPNQAPIALADAIEEVARDTGLQPSQIREHLKKIPILKYIITDFEGQVAANPEFLEKLKLWLVSDGISNMVWQAGIEVETRWGKGDRWEEWLTGSINLGSSALMTAVMDYILLRTPLKPGLASNKVIMEENKRFFRDTWDWMKAEGRVALHRSNMPTWCLVGVGSTGVFGGIEQMIRANTDDADQIPVKDRVEAVGKDMLFGCGFAGVSSYWRYRLMEYTQEGMVPRFVSKDSKALAGIFKLKDISNDRSFILKGINLGNAWLASKNFTVVRMIIGVSDLEKQKTSIEITDEDRKNGFKEVDVYLRVERNIENGVGSFAGLDDVP